MIAKMRIALLSLVAAVAAVPIGAAVAESGDSAGAEDQVQKAEGDPGEAAVYGYGEIDDEFADRLRDATKDGAGTPITSEMVKECERAPEKGGCALILAAEGN